MKQIWSLRWKKLLIWICGYLSIVAFAIVGGYTIVRSDSRALKQTSKNAFIAVVVFTVLEAIRLLLSSIGSVSGGMAGFLAVYVMLVALAKIIVFACCAIIAFCGGKGDVQDDEPAADQPDKKDDGKEEPNAFPSQEEEE